MKQVALVLVLLLSAILTSAQTTDSKELKERRARARSLLISLSTDARSFHDQTLRARSLARIADALWQVDAEQARLLFRKAWDAAEAADLDNDRKLQEEIARQKSRSGTFAVNSPPNLRREVLKLAVRHDRALSEEFLEKLKTQKLEQAASATNPNATNRLSESLTQRLGVAREILQFGEADRALQFAGPALAVPSREGIEFMSTLRDKNPSLADSAYNALLASWANNPQSDANTVSLLSSYIFTPHLQVIFSPTGVSTSQSASTITPAAVSPELRTAFFQTAAGILMRPLPPPGQPDQSTTGLDGKYLVIKRLLPFFEQSAAAEMVESLRGQMNALNTVVSDSTRKRDDDWATSNSKRDKPSAAAREQSLLDRIDRAKTSAERDSLYLELAFVTGNKGDSRARDFAGKLEDTELRKQVQAYVDASLTQYFVGKKLTDQALEMVHNGDLTHIIKTWALTECAKIIAKTDHDKALALIDEAATEARRNEELDPALPRGLIAVANAVNVIDPERVWDATFDAVKAANSAEGFTGEDGEVVVKFQSKGHSSVHTSDVAAFDLEGIFKDLANRDYDRAVELARGFQAEGPRAVATIAIARAILDADKRK